MNKNAGSMYLKAKIKRKLRDFTLDLDLEAGAGCLGILGPSGCGKSMTLKSVAGIVTPDSGRIALSGAGRERILYDSDARVNLRPQDRRAGYLFQNYALFPNMTVAENIGAGLKNRSGARARIAEMISGFRLDGLEHNYPRQLSGGQQQRVALARILAYEPEVLLLDEPFSAMDTYLREGLRLELSKVLAGYRGAAVMVTHDRDEAYQLCEDLILMDQGKVLAGGKTRAVFESPGSCKAARLTGCKNISRIERLGRHRVRAVDWGGLELSVAGEVSGRITAVGIRAHEFEPLTDAEAKPFKERPDGNLIDAAAPDISEMPFEWYITLNNGLWWKKEKNISTHDTAGVTPDWLRIDPAAILLLTGELD